VAGTRITLDSIVQCFDEGLSPEAILGEFETLTHTQVFGAITFYLKTNPQSILIACAKSSASKLREDLRSPCRRTCASASLTRANSSIPDARNR